MENRVEVCEDRLIRRVRIRCPMAERQAARDWVAKRGLHMVAFGPAKEGVFYDTETFEVVAEATVSPDDVERPGGLKPQFYELSVAEGSAG